MILYCATTNRGKLREFQMALENSFQVESLPGLASIPPCEESGATFLINACLKATAYAQAHEVAAARTRTNARDLREQIRIEAG